MELQCLSVSFRTCFAGGPCEVVVGGWSGCTACKQVPGCIYMHECMHACMNRQCLCCCLSHQRRCHPSFYHAAGCNSHYNSGCIFSLRCIELMLFLLFIDACMHACMHTCTHAPVACISCLGAPLFKIFRRECFEHQNYERRDCWRGREGVSSSFL